MQEKKAGNVSRLENEYTKTKTLQAHREWKQKRQMRRRVARILIISLLLITGLSGKIWASTRTVSDLKVKQEQATEQLSQVQAEQEQLNRQIRMLEDEEYVLKMARSQYYLSKDNEIIFSLPEDNATLTEETETDEQEAGESEE